MTTADLTWIAFTWIALLGLTAGLLIGCVGIGGVLLVPALVFLGEIPIRIAISAAMMAYIVAGLIATVVFTQKKSIQWGMAGWLCLGATPTAYAGAWAVSILNPRLLEAGIGFLTLLSGVNALRTRTVADAAQNRISKSTLLSVGAVTGFLSSMSGTGGPLVAVPILLTLGVPVLTAVGLSQAMQLPITITATLGNMLYGAFDLTLGAILAVSLTIGTWFGARLAHAVPRTTLHRTVSCVLIAVGTFIFANIAWHLLK